MKRTRRPARFTVKRLNRAFGPRVFVGARLPGALVSARVGWFDERLFQVRGWGAIHSVSQAAGLR